MEKRVAKILRNLGKRNIRQNVMMKDTNGCLSEIDVSHGIFFRQYIECKNYSGHAVPLEDVAKFKEVLNLNYIPISRGLFVTTSTYTPRATLIGIKCIDGEELKKWEKWSRKVYWIRMLLKLCFLLAMMVALYIYLYEPQMLQYLIKQANQARSTIESTEYYKQLIKKL
uniref:Restriction endonuclease type IV Mrr domain-containing protein n=1 Tax=Arcella intermedia TaxID=1963864 RepID=A0A6B2LML5_9EUKA